MKDVVQTRELLASTELFGFDTKCWAAGRAASRKTAARRGIKEGTRYVPQDETAIIEALNAPAEPVEAPVAETAETAETA